MLVLTRRKYEQLTIQVGSETVTVRVVDVGRDRVRLGITAPPSVAVHREEVALRIARENAEAGSFEMASAAAR